MNRDEDRPEAIQQRPAVAPFVDIYESADELLVVADLPGVAQDGLSIQVEKGELLIDARRSNAAQLEPGNDKAVVPDLRRSFVVPRGIDAEKISADLKDGVLRVHLPKAAALKPRQIPIKSS
jgi:HSP20 family molecular chaperone IbpA